jgi:ElaB/YqjD/DUF883 family membrane-anchored ribosome-binding protein
MSCDRTPTEAHNDGVEAQRKADETKAQARKEVTEKVAEADRAVQRASDEARREAAQAQATANQKIREANREITADMRGDVRTWAQEKLDDVDNMIDTANAKAQTAAPASKAKFNDALKDVKHEREVLQTEIVSLEKGAGEGLGKTKEQFVARVDRLKDDIRSIEKSL